MQFAQIRPGRKFFAEKTDGNLYIKDRENVPWWFGEYLLKISI